MGAGSGARAQSRLQCRCCPVDGGLSSKLPDAALLYQLMDAHGEFINVQDWFQVRCLVISFLLVRY
jgi:hypothetical protein